MQIHHNQILRTKFWLIRCNKKCRYPIWIKRHQAQQSPPVARTTVKTPKTKETTPVVLTRACLRAP